MLKLIIGPKGSGKTKKLINLANNSAATSLGTVVCIEQTPNLAGHISRTIRLIETEDFNINDQNSLAGFVKGLVANNYDTTDIFIDSTFKIIKRDYDKLPEFIQELYTLSKNYDLNIFITLSCKKSDLPEFACPVQLVE